MIVVVGFVAVGFGFGFARCRDGRGVLVSIDVRCEM